MHKAEDAASLEDLLRLQEEFQARSEVPAAKVTFVGDARRQAESTNQGHVPVSAAAGSHHNTSTGDVELQEHAAEKSTLVGDVIERVVETTQPPPVPTHPAAGGGFPLAKHRRQSRFALSRRAKQSTDPPTEATASLGEAASAVAAAEMAVSGAEADIDAENRAALQKMSSQEVEAARKEVADRLGPEKVAFLRKRAAQRSQQAAQKTEHDHKEPKGDSAPRLKANDSQGTWTPPIQAPAEVPQISGAEAEGKPVSRIRFSLSGEPVGWKSAIEEEAQTSVVERDLLRQDEGTVSGGYTVHEMCQLARSSLPAQRAFACRHLAALLARTRPTMADAYAALFGHGDISKPLHVPGSDQAPQCDWKDVWEHALKDCQLAVVLRVALDDNSQSVLTAAAEALTQLVALEDSGPALSRPTPSGLPVVPSRYLERPHASSAWSALPIEMPKPPEMPSMPQNAAEKELEQQLDERQVAAKDPLAGLLQMQILARISYLLQAGVGVAAAVALFAILHATALGGHDMVSAICNTPGLVKALLAVLDDAAPNGSGHTLGQTLQPLRPQVLGVLRMMCQAGADVARHLSGQGLKAQVTRFVLGSGNAAAPAPSTPLLLQVEALRIWRICACYGLNVMSFDDAYPMLWPHLGVPNWTSLAAPAGNGMEAQSTCLHMTAAAETLMTVAELLLDAGRAPDQAHLSPRCAAAVLQEAVAWLQPQSMQSFFDNIQGVSGEGNGSGDGHRAAQAALLALSAVLEIVRACTLLPDLKNDSSEAAALVAGMSAHTEPCPPCEGHSRDQESFVCKLITFLAKLLSTLQDDKISPPSLTKGRAGTLVALCEVLTSYLRTGHATNVTGGDALEHQNIALRDLVNPATFMGFAPELVVLQPSAAGAFQVQQAILNLALTFLEQALHRPDREGTNRDLLSAALRVPCLAPPGGEDLALRAMSCALHVDIYSAQHDCGTKLVTEFSKLGVSLSTAAGMLGAWWQEGDPEVKSNPLPVLPTAKEVRDELLPAYIAHWLGLIPEGPPPSANAEGSPTAGGPPAAVAPLLKQSLIRQPVGSRLPIPPYWMFGIEPVPAEVRTSGGLDTIAEEDEPIGAQQLERSCQARIVSLGLLFWLALEAHPHVPCLHEVRRGMETKCLMDLVFSPASPSICNGEGHTDEALWLDPLIRWTTAALLDTYACDMPQEIITEVDAARWAAHFATVSYGDALFASALTVLLRPGMPAPVQVTVLKVLAEEGALHLLPPHARAPGKWEYYIGRERPKEVTRLLEKLLEDGSLQKAKEANSMVYDLAVESHTC